MGKLGFYFDMERCIGCKACQVACKDRNRLEADENFRTVRIFTIGKYPNVGLYNYSGACNHCTDPACVRNCPTGATFIAEDGTVQHDDTMCIFCKTCVGACPYGAPVPMESLQVVHKCDSCKPLRDAGMNPACVDGCPMRALEFGDLDELKKKHEGELVDKIACLPEPTTIPSILIKAKEIASDDNFKQIYW